MCVGSLLRLCQFSIKRTNSQPAAESYLRYSTVYLVILFCSLQRTRGRRRSVYGGTTHFYPIYHPFILVCHETRYLRFTAGPYLQAAQKAPRDRNGRDSQSYGEFRFKRLPGKHPFSSKKGSEFNGQRTRTAAFFPSVPLFNTFFFAIEFFSLVFCEKKIHAAQTKK